jgi:hypothetical protein
MFFAKVPAPAPIAAAIIEQPTDGQFVGSINCTPDSTFAITI